MREGKFPGSFFCPRPDSTGPKGFCSHRVSQGAVRDDAPVHISQVPVVQEYSTNPPFAKTWEASDARVSAALNFAGRIYQGMGASYEQQALQLAERALLMFERKP